LVEARETRMGVAQDQQTPRVARKCKAPCDRAGILKSFFAVHTKKIVTYFQIDSIVRIGLILTLPNGDLNDEEK
jgi:hypothetical protein